MILCYPFTCSRERSSEKRLVLILKHIRPCQRGNFKILPPPRKVSVQISYEQSGGRERYCVQSKRDKLSIRDRRGCHKHADDKDGDRSWRCARRSCVAGVGRDTDEYRDGRKRFDKIVLFVKGI